MMLQKLLFSICLFISLAAMAQKDSSVVYFNFNKYDITSRTQQILEKIAAIPNKLSVSIYGHTDQLGSCTYNDKLSLQRARAVKNYLTAKGLDASTIKVLKGFGEALPVMNKLDEVSRQANRRVVIITEFSIASTDSPVDTTPQAKIQVPKTDTFSTKSRKDLTEKIKDSTTKEGQNIILKNIHFYGGRHIFLPQSYPALMELYNAMKDISTLEIEIHGHICCMDGPRDGLDIDTGEPFLSYNRARAVYEWLVKKGINPKRIKYKGFGHKFPIIPVETSEEERTINRRVEIKIMKK